MAGVPSISVFLRMVLTATGVIFLDLTWIEDAYFSAEQPLQYTDGFGERSYESFLREVSKLSLTHKGNVTQSPLLHAALRAFSARCDTPGDFSPTKVWACVRGGDIYLRTCNDPTRAMKLLSVAYSINDDLPDMLLYIGQVHASHRQHAQTAYHYFRRSMNTSAISTFELPYPNFLMWKRTAELVATCYAPREMAYLYLKYPAEISSIPNAPQTIAEILAMALEQCEAQYTKSALKELLSFVNVQLAQPVPDPPQTVETDLRPTTTQGEEISPDLPIGPREAILILLKFFASVAPALHGPLSQRLSGIIVAGRYVPNTEFDTVVESSLGIVRERRGSHFARLSVWELVDDMYKMLREHVVAQSSTTQVICTVGANAARGLDEVMVSYEEAFMLGLSAGERETLQTLIRKVHDVCQYH